jgi:hypothetical protein
MMTEKLEGIWKEATVTQSGYHPNIFLEELRKTTKIVRKTGYPSGDANRALRVDEFTALRNPIGVCVCECRVDFTVVAVKRLVGHSNRYSRSVSAWSQCRPMPVSQVLSPLLN